MSAATPAEAPRPVIVAVRFVYALIAVLAISLLVRAILYTIGPADAALSVVSGVLYGLLAYYVGRGKNVARILVWFSAAVVAASFPILIIGNVVVGPVAGSPGWYFGYTLAVSAVRLGLLAAASILLWRPAARPYFQHGPRS